MSDVPAPATPAPADPGRDQLAGGERREQQHERDHHPAAPYPAGHRLNDQPRGDHQPGDLPPAAHRPAVHQPTGSAAKPSTRLLSLVHRLVAFGRDLITTLREQPASQAARTATRVFGTLSLVAIIARITRGLRLAATLEQRIQQNRAGIDSRQTRAFAPPATRAATPLTARRLPRVSPGDGAPPAGLPTAAAIARKVRTQPIGEVLAQICRDLGLTPGDALWREVHMAVTLHGGNYVRLVTGVLTGIHVFRLPFDTAPIPVPPESRGPGEPMSATGPP